MTGVAADERLRLARLERGEDLAALSSRTGLRVHHVRAIEEGRFADLPPGIYGRSAVRTLASAYDLDADALLAECEALLPRLEDPIDALARKCGVSRAPGRSAAATGSSAAPDLSWRPFGAASLDGAVAGALLFVPGAGAALLAHVSPTALGGSAMSFVVLGVVLGSAYYVWLGGLGGTTLGEYAVGPEPRRRDPRPLTLHAIRLRTVAAATADVRAIHAWGRWAGRRLTPGAGRSAPPTGLSPSPPPPRGREAASRWSMRRRACGPPPPLHPRRG